MTRERHSDGEDIQSRNGAPPARETGASGFPEDEDAGQREIGDGEDAENEESFEIAEAADGDEELNDH